MADQRKNSWWGALVAGPSGPLPAGWWRRTWARVCWPFEMSWRHARNRWLLARGNRAPRRWWRPRRWLPVTVITLLAGLYLAWLISAAVLLATNDPGWHWFWLSPTGKDPAFGYAFGVLSSVVLTIAGGALSTIGWLAWRYNRVRWFYQRRARKEPARLVDAGSIVTNDVVGRDQLCDALMRDLSSPKNRRPHVVVGTVGLGKTALLVCMTRRLVRKRAVPVPIQLRSVGDPESLDFEKLAHKAFCNAVQNRLVSDGEGEKVWRRLRKLNDRVVVLADGLDEVLRDFEDRDAHIRRALDKAKDDRLPLVITSRPQATLRGLDAAITELEPLNPDDAAGYISEHSTWRANERQVDMVVEAAQVTESPFYLQIAMQLHEQDLLEDVLSGIGHETDAPRDRERWAVRFDLLERWVQAFEDGWLAPELPLSQRERKAAIEYACALACVGLLKDRADVEFADLETQRKKHDEEMDDVWRLLRASYSLENRFAAVAGGRGSASTDEVPLPASLVGSDGSHASPDGEVLAPPVYDSILTRLEERINKLGVRVDKRVAATWADQMGLLDACGDRVRFQHSILQAYLGSRYLDALIKAADSPAGPGAPAESSKTLANSLRNPGRELIIAFTLYSRSEEPKCGCTQQVPDGHCGIRRASSLLARAARTTFNVNDVRVRAATDGAARAEDPSDCQRKGLEMYAAALEIDSFDQRPKHSHIVSEIKACWESLQSSEQAKLEQDKIDLVRRIGATSRLVAPLRVRTGYEYLFDMAAMEKSYPVRYAIGEEIGAGGNAAYREISAKLKSKLPSPLQAPSALVPARRQEERAQVVATMRIPMLARAVLTFSERGEFAVEEERPADPVQGDRLRRKTAWDDKRQREDDERSAELDERSKMEKEWRTKILCAWISPLLVESCTFGAEEKAREDGHEFSSPYANLRSWVDALRDQAAPDRTYSNLELQLALAQGFKQAANRRRRSASTSSEKRELLVGQATKLLGDCHFWFTRLTLLHALTLWEVRDDVMREQPMRGPGSSARKQVERWLAHKPESMGTEHPLVVAAGKAARHALQTCRPDHFLWIDETGVVYKVGSRTRLPRNPRQDYWIAPSTGWSTLEPPAQQLLADILVMAALTDERGDSPQNVLERLRQTDRSGEDGLKEFLPPCVFKDRGSLAPRSPAVLAGKPGSNCLPDCNFDLCPYPSKGPDCRVEFSEMFCIQQRGLYDRLQMAAWVRLRIRRKGQWQHHMPAAELRRFWDEMADRARNIPLAPSSVRAHNSRDRQP